MVLLTYNKNLLLEGNTSALLTTGAASTDLHVVSESNHADTWHR